MLVLHTALVVEVLSETKLVASVLDVLSCIFIIQSDIVLVVCRWIFLAGVLVRVPLSWPAM